MNVQTRLTPSLAKRLAGVTEGLKQRSDLIGYGKLTPSAVLRLVIGRGITVVEMELDKGNA